MSPALSLFSFLSAVKVADSLSSNMVQNEKLDNAMQCSRVFAVLGPRSVRSHGVEHAVEVWKLSLQQPFSIGASEGGVTFSQLLPSLASSKLANDKQGLCGPDIPEANLFVGVAEHE